jgi:MFS family permease
VSGRPGARKVDERWPPDGTVLGVCLLAFFSTMVARLVISPVVPSVRMEFGVSDGEVGLALTGMWIAYALAHYPSGRLADHLGERRVVLGAVGLTAVGGVVLAFASQFVVFGLMAVVLGAAAGLYYPAGASLLSKRFENVGQALGFHIAGASLAGLVTPVAVSQLAIWAGWRTALLLAPTVAIPVWLVFAWQIPGRTSHRPEESTTISRPDGGVRSGGILGTLRQPIMAFTVVLAAIQSFVFSATLSFLPSFLQSYHGSGRLEAGLLFSTFFVVLGLAQPSAGRLSDVVGRAETAALAFAISAAGFATLVFASGLTTVAVGVAFAGMGLSAIVALESQFMDAIDDGDRGTGFGIVRMSYVLLGAGGSAVTGALADRAGWAVAFGLFVVLLAGAALAAAASRSRRRI